MVINGFSTSGIELEKYTGVAFFFNIVLFYGILWTVPSFNFVTKSLSTFFSRKCKSHIFEFFVSVFFACNDTALDRSFEIYEGKARKQIYNKET